MPRNDYEERKESRIDRLHERAEKAASDSAAAHETASSMASVIPFGQPILVGHHSERRDRNYRDRIRAKMGKAVELGDKADRLVQRAASAESNQAISSDDPTAVVKIKERIQEAQEQQNTMKAANKIIRRKPKNESTPEKLAELAAMGFAESKAPRLFIPDWCGRYGFADYVTKNNNANIRRMKARLVELEAALVRSVEEDNKETDCGICKLVENVEINRVQLVFDGKPSEEIRATLKSSGFRWSRYEGAWQRHLNNAGIWAAKHVAETIKRNSA